MKRLIAACASALLLLPIAAAAQGAPPGGQGPMTVERITSSFLVTPEVKVTRFDRRTTELVGAYAGWLHDDTFFIGGGGYLMPRRSRDRQLAYGGVVIGMQTRRDRRVGFAVKGLFGGGRATVKRSISWFDGHDGDVHILTTGGAMPAIFPPIVTNVRVREEFFVAEPEASALVTLTRRFRITAGAGYRWVGRRRGGHDGLDGASGSIGLQIGR